MSDPAASVRARLLNVARAQGVDVNQVLVRFALERILYRMSQSEHAEFPAQGALLFILWYDMPHRATRDAELLGFGASDLASVAQTFRDIPATRHDTARCLADRPERRVCARCVAPITVAGVPQGKMDSTPSPCLPSRSGCAQPWCPH